VHRRSILACALAGTALPWRASAQGDARVTRIGWLTAQRAPSLTPYVGAFRSALAGFGHVEGRNLAIEFRYGDDEIERVVPLAEELVRLPVDLIVAQGAAAFEIAKLNLKLPVVYAYSGDPVEAGLVDSLPRPGRNLSGISMLSLELVGKRMQLLADAVPGMRRLALVSNPGHAGERRELAASQAAAVTLGLEVSYLPLRGDAALDETLQGALRAGCEGIVVFPDQGMMRRSERFAAFAQQHRMPATSGWAEFARRGNLMSYGPNIQQVFRRLGSYVDRVLKGTRPGDLPVELPVTIEHIVNLRSARAMRLPLSRSLLLGADEVIE